MEDKLKIAQQELDQYKSDVPVEEAVRIIGRVTGLKVELLRSTEVEKAVEHAKAELRSGRVRDTPWKVNKEIQDSSPERWEDISQEARSTVAALWAPKVGADLVITSLDPDQPKDKILTMIENFLVQKERIQLGKSLR